MKYAIAKQCIPQLASMEGIVCSMKGKVRCKHLASIDRQCCSARLSFSLVFVFLLVLSISFSLSLSHSPPPRRQGNTYTLIVLDRLNRSSTTLRNTSRQSFHLLPTFLDIFYIDYHPFVCFLLLLYSFLPFLQRFCNLSLCVYLP